MDISIVVPFYNEERYIEDCIKALLSQDYPQNNFEIIMVDNNSTDRSVEIVGQYPRVKLLSEACPGDFAARNRGIEEASGEVIAFTDSDTAPHRDWLQNIMVAMQDSEVGIVVGGLQYPVESKGLAMMASYEQEKSTYIFSGDTKEIYFGYTCNMAVRQTLFKTMGPFPSVYRNSDIVFLLQAIDAYSCDVVCYSPQVCVRRLEVSNLWAFYNKQYIYGRDLTRYNKLTSARSLSTTERLQIFKYTVKKRGYSLQNSIFLFFLLFVGGISYELGRLRGA